MKICLCHHEMVERDAGSPFKKNEDGSNCCEVDMHSKNYMQTIEKSSDALELERNE